MFQYALCNEVFGSAPLGNVCSALRECGYGGIEIAPFTLTESPSTARDAFTRNSLTYVGLHWLLVSPPGLHVTTPDEPLRRRSWDHVRDLIDLSADLAGSQPSIMVFGSPRQRGATAGSTPQQATGLFIEGLRSVAPYAESKGVTVLVEALPANQCDVINTLAEAVAVVDAVHSPAVATMFDAHNTADETSPPAELIERYFDRIRHVHLNEMDGRYPGTGSYDFTQVLQTLERLKYQGWVSIEVFDFTPGPLEIARNSLRFLHSQT